ncbi:MAG: RodZ domain-containing protein [Armatimonadota bacterium]
MENNETIGAMLLQERQKRELSLDEVHDATKITVHNLAALEEDRFDHFPNRVYARAFLRDYANFLGLDSGELLEKYEYDWQGVIRETAPQPPKRKSVWKSVLVTLLTLVVLGGLTATVYFYDKGWGIKVPAAIRGNVGKPDVAQLPKPEPIVPAPVKPEAKKPAGQPKAEKPAAPQSLSLEVTASRPVWADIKADGQKVIYGMLPAGIKTVTAKKVVFIKVGQATAVSLKLNDKQLPPMGTSANMAKAEFRLPAQPAKTAPVTGPGKTPAGAAAGTTSKPAGQ